MNLKSPLDVHRKVKEEKEKADSETARKAASDEQTSAVANEDPTTCPVCGQALQKVFAADNIETLVCVQDRVAYPVKDS